MAGGYIGGSTGSGGNASGFPGEQETVSADCLASSPQKPRGSGACSTASFCSSASSTGSTPTGARARRSPYVGCSPLVAAGPLKGNSHSAAHDPRQSGRWSQPQLSGSTVTPDSCASGTLSMVPSRTHGHPVGPVGGRGLGPPSQGRAAASRDGSRGSSPWHLPSPMSELSMASDRFNSSQPSGSDSCGEHPLPQYGGAQCNFDECAFEDPSGQSDTPHGIRSSNLLSDSDCATPRSHDTVSVGPAKGQAQPQTTLWENMHSEVSRLGHRLHPRLDIAQSPGSTTLGNFREAVGMNESGPVIPFGHGAARMKAPGMSQPGADAERPHSTETAAAASSSSFGTFGPPLRVPGGESSSSFAVNSHDVHGEYGVGGNSGGANYRRRRGKHHH